MLFISICSPADHDVLAWAIWCGQNERKWTATAGALHISQPVHHELVLPDQTPTQSLLETPALKALAPVEPDPGQALLPQERASHPFQSECRLRHRPFDQAPAEEIPPHQTTGTSMH